MCAAKINSKIASVADYSKCIFTPCSDQSLTQYCISYKVPLLKRECLNDIQLNWDVKLEKLENLKETLRYPELRLKSFFADAKFSI